ncbi:MAG: thiol peroxidase [Candidatus Omnitrophota bacterium]
MDAKITFKSKPLSLAGRNIREGMRAPDFTATDPNLKKVRLSDYKGSVRVVTSFLSLDTPVCDLQVKEFNKQAKELSEGVVIIGVSQDLPFAQKRFCESNHIDKVITLSDYMTNSFGINYGLLIRELRLLARAVIIIDKDDVIRYVQVVEEATHAPDYKAAMDALKAVTESPAIPASGVPAPSRCLPCEAGAKPLAKDRAEKLLGNIKGWELLEGKKIRKTFKFKDFVEASYFVDLAGIVAEEQGHHPDMCIYYNKVTVALTTHAIGGLSDNDFIMAGMIDGLQA